ncbi:GNAT family N-acetyltransferase [Longispora sp. K20-0274]|uniref:GNAT family N-acetyltransferase n=1 Tax=Longispora sp. K20-0274 TaxID=3088255 RepID=UPI00399B8A41
MNANPPIDPVEIAAGPYLLRPPAARDAADLWAMADDPAILRWNTQIGGLPHEAAARDWCERMADWSEGRRATFIVSDPAGDRLLGIAVLHHVDAVQQSAEVGYTVAPWARRRGVAVASVTALCRWGYDALDLVRIGLLHSTLNTASCRVAERSGFALEGVTRSSYRYADGRLHDEHLHARLRTDPPTA